MLRERIDDNQNHLLYSVFPYHPETNSIGEFFRQFETLHLKKKVQILIYEDIEILQ